MDRESEYELEVKQIAVPGVPRGLGVGRLEAGELGCVSRVRRAEKNLLKSRKILVFSP